MTGVWYCSAALNASTVSANVKPGSYVFYCSVDGHAAAGMRGVLTVK